MALRMFARDTASRFGFGPSALACSQGFSLQTTICRSFATVVEGLKYAKSHEWAKVEGGTATIGISDFAQEALGDVVYVELPEVGSEVTAGTPFGVVESVKAASDVYSPISGEVVEVNEALSGEPATVNSEPFTGGWMMKVKLSDASELDKLMDSAAYEKVVEEAAH